MKTLCLSVCFVSIDWFTVYLMNQYLYFLGDENPMFLRLVVLIYRLVHSLLDESILVFLGDENPPFLHLFVL